MQNINADAMRLERQSSAITLSDMEMFIFPELIYALMLANIMSPRLWAWRDDPWFAGLDKATPYRRLVRLKQYIMDHYEFNLDLDTWGLTTKDKEVARFRNFIDEDTLAQSNALFGYEGDKYYFDIDIRTHFGLDKVEGHVIPYWKTETVEAMDAFCYKPDYRVGAGECVSLSALYAAALFVVARIPLKDIYLMATPLHSQNFVDVDEGVLTNNRRLITKTMWFNGSELSTQGRRALENERVTYVAHESGWIHTVYPDFSMDPEAYARFSSRLRTYLTIPLTPEILCNFLRQNGCYQKCFQLRHAIRGCDRYIGVERVYAYEHGSPYRFSDRTRPKLLGEVDPEEFTPCCAALPDRLLLNDIEALLSAKPCDLQVERDRQALTTAFGAGLADPDKLLDALTAFCITDPRLPVIEGKQRTPLADTLALNADMSREAVIERLEQLRTTHPYADMAFYAYRDLNRTEPEPFLKAAVERNPVIVEAMRDKAWPAIVEAVTALTDESIYDEPGRLAQPDEVWNSQRGDGVEKAILLASLYRQHHPDVALTLAVAPDRAVLRTPQGDIALTSRKGLNPGQWRV